MATDPLLKKLQHKGGVPVLVLWAPDEVQPAIDAWEAEGVTVHRHQRGGSPFVLAFVRSRKEIADRAMRLSDLLGGDDPVLWLAYPKRSSTRYSSDVGRDDSWQPIGDLGFEPVRQVAIDDDWSALRFRRSGDVKTMTRSRGAISSEGRARVGGVDVEQWLGALPEARRPLVRALHDLVRKAAPKLAPSASGKFLGYGPFHYRYETGREGDAFRVSIANNAQYVSVYVLGEGSNGGYIAEEWADRLGVPVGKSCIRIKKLDDVDFDALRALVKEAAAQQP